MGLYEHVPGQRDFPILDKEVSVTEFRRRPAAVWKYGNFEHWRFHEKNMDPRATF